MDKVNVINGSLRCCKFGWLSLIPGLGLLCAAVALMEHRRVKTASGQERNVAGKHLRQGMRLALFSVIYHAMLVIWLIGGGADLLGTPHRATGR